MRTRSGPEPEPPKKVAAPQWHTSPTGNWTHNLGVLSISFKLLPVLPSRIRPWPPLISTVHDLKAEGPLSESLRGVQLEVGQSAVVKPPFEREEEAQHFSHHSLFLTPNSRVTVLSYQDRQHKLPRLTNLSLSRLLQMQWHTHIFGLSARYVEYIYSNKHIPLYPPQTWHKD